MGRRLGHASMQTHGKRKGRGEGSRGKAGEGGTRIRRTTNRGGRREITGPSRERMGGRKEREWGSEMDAGKGRNGGGGRGGVGERAPSPAP